MTQTVTVFQTTKNSLYLIVLTIIGISAPFWHLFATTGQKGILHWRWMSSFLNALGVPFLAICIGLLLKYASKMIPEHNFKFVFNTIGNVVVYIGGYYLLYVFIAIKDFSNGVYFSFLALLSILLFFIIIYINKGALKSERKLRKALDSISRFAFITVKKFINDDKLEEYKEESIDALNEGRL